MDLVETIANRGHRDEPDEEREIDSVEAFAILASPKRRRILSYLADQEATTSMMAAALGVERHSLYHHLERLLEAGMVKVSREVQVGRLSVRLYRATARRFRLEVDLADADGERTATA